MFARGLAEEPWSVLLIIQPYLQCIMPDLVRESAVWVSKFCSVCELCYFTIHLASVSPGPHIVPLPSHRLIFWTEPFYNRFYRFCLILALWEQKMLKIWGRNNPIKNIYHILTHQAQIVSKILISFHNLRKSILAPENHCTDIVPVMWRESFELVFLGSLFHW